MSNRLFLVALLLLMSPLGSFAVGVNSSSVSNTNSSSTSIKDSTDDDIAQNARRWKLSVEEWQRYEEIMKGEGRFNWTNADPITVLGIYAETTEERDHYAERLAIQEHEITKKFLALNTAYMYAFRRLYGNEPLLDKSKFDAFYGVDATAPVLPTKRRSSRIGDALGDRYVLFITPNCKGCNIAYEKIVGELKFGTSLDIYFVGVKSDDDIIRWATSMSLDPSLVKNKMVTLNRDDGTYAKYNRPSLPAAFYYAKSSESVMPVNQQDIK